MKKIVLVLTVFLSTYSITAQELMGNWSGTLNVQGTRLRVIFNISEDIKGYSSTMDSPDQGVKDIPVASTSFENSTVKLEVPAARISYEGVYRDSLIVGTFTQNNQDFSLNLSRQLVKDKVAPRPQEPVKPYPYGSEKVTFENRKANITLAGTLTIPKNKNVFPTVILISGSGPQNRDEELMGHKPFLVLSDYLTRNGIAVLRYDDRGFGESTGDFSTATTADFATDVKSAIAYLKSRKDIDNTRIGLIGHSEGGLIAPMVAAESTDVGFIILMAGSGIRGDKLLLRQEELIERVLGTPETEIKNLLETNAKIFDAILSSKDDKNLRSKLKLILEESFEGTSAPKTPDGMTEEEFIAAQINQFTSPWVKYFLRYDPSENLEKVKFPVMAINGEKDLQVPPEENLTAIRNALHKGGNSYVSIKEYEDLNHLFQESETGSPMEYSVIEQTIAPFVLQEVTEWIKAKTE
jgi:pimeloyl-ACP methyl ester carboxylesterase